MATMSLRRTKEKTLVGLPSKTIETIYVELSAEEREIYDQMELKAKRIIAEYINAESSMKSYWTVLSALVRLRQICTDVAMCPPELRDLLPVNKIAGNLFGVTFCVIFALHCLVFFPSHISLPNYGCK